MESTVQNQTVLVPNNPEDFMYRHPKTLFFKEMDCHYQTAQEAITKIKSLRNTLCNFWVSY